MCVKALLLLVCGFSVVIQQGCFALRSPAGGSQATFSGTRPIHTADIAVSPGYRIEAVVSGLTFPTGVTFDDHGRLYLIEAGYSYGEVWTTPKLLRVGEDGQTTLILEGQNNGPWTGVSFHQGHFYIAEGGTLRGGRLLRVALDGTVESLLEGLPSIGDHHTNGPVIGPDGLLYFSLGTTTNSGIVGQDNAKFGWLSRYPRGHDLPCRDIVLAGENYKSPNPLTPEPDDTAMTGAFSSFGQQTATQHTVRGQIPCSGAVFRIPLPSGPLELVAWGFRNPFGLAFAPSGDLFVTDNSYDDRGSRPVHGAGDLLWRVIPGAWYGWPDFHGTRLLSDGDHYVPPGKPRPKPLLASHPNVPPDPVAILDVHASADGFDFSRNPTFGYVGQAFIALFGDQSPTSGKVLGPVGFKVVRVETAAGVIQDFAVNRGRVNGPASRIGGGGFERPVAARFDPTGTALYVVDFGVMTIGQGGKVRMPWAPRATTSESRQGTGVLWKITKE
ncbi:MAG: glucose dehydrogenase [Nitrospirales bacterium]|nr:glucose dehydrogenase [Nitrospirales bacterium]